MDQSYYGPVSGNIRSGEAVSVRPGDIVTGLDVWERKVSGRVIATHPYYPSVTIDGLHFTAGEPTPGRFTIHLSQVDSVVEPKGDTLIGVAFGADR